MERAQAEDWYRVETAGNGVTKISERYIEEFYRCNVWHVRGRERDMLVDSGMGVVSLREWVPLVTEKPVTAVASHTHFDHIGNHHEFADRVVHAAEANILAEPTRPTTLADPYVTDGIFARLPPAPYRSTDYNVTGAAATRTVEDGDVIDLGDRHFTVIHAPGHSPGSIALFEESTGVMFTGDVVYDGPLIEDTYHSNIDDYIASMERLLAFPVRVVHGGHFPSFGGARYRALIRDWLELKSGARNHGLPAP